MLAPLSQIHRTESVVILMTMAVALANWLCARPPRTLMGRLDLMALSSHQGEAAHLSC